MECFDYPPVNHIEIRDGQARLVGRPLKIKMVVSRIIHGGATIEETMEQYNVSRAQVYAALAYYFEHQEAMDRDYDEEERIAREEIPSLDDLLARLRSRNESQE